MFDPNSVQFFKLTQKKKDHTKFFHDKKYSEANFPPLGNPETSEPSVADFFHKKDKNVSDSAQETSEPVTKRLRNDSNENVTNIVESDPNGNVDSEATHQDDDSQESMELRERYWALRGTPVPNMNEEGEEEDTAAKDPLTIKDHTRVIHAMKDPTRQIHPLTIKDPTRERVI